MQQLHGSVAAMTSSQWLLATCTVVNAYLLGVMVVLQRVVYPLFGNVSRVEFGSYYASFGPRIGLPVVLPEFLAFLVVIPLVWLRPSGVPAWSVYAAIAAGVAYFAITFGLHLPVHRLLAAGDNSAPVIASLVRTHAARTWVQAGKCGLLAWMTVAAMRG
jgi:hypothetical protein